MWYDINYIRDGYKIYQNSDIFSIGYPYGEDASCGSGKLNKINNFEFEHTIPTDIGASGSPILLLNNNINFVKVIGIHKEADLSKNINLGTFIGEIINYYNKNTQISNLNISLNSINHKMEQISLSNMPDKNQNSKIQINGIKSNVNNNKKFIYAYKKLIDSLNNLRHNKFDLKNIETIKVLLDKKLLIQLPVFIIENSKIKYINDLLKQTDISISSFLSEKDILFYDKISESTKYSFINEEICKYFMIQNISKLKQVSLFVNIANNIKYIYVYYNNQNCGCLFTLIDYNNNSFNFKNNIIPREKYENELINLFFVFDKNILCIQCKRNEKTSDVIRRFEIKYGLIKRRIFYIFNSRRLNDYREMTIDQCGLINCSQILMIDTNNIVG